MKEKEFKPELSLNNPDQDLTIENILKKVPELALWRHYIGFDFKIGKPFTTPYRPTDGVSFSLRYDYRGRLMFKDFARTNIYGDIFNYLQLTQHITFIESLEKVNEDFELKLINRSSIIVDKAKRLKVQKVENIDKLLKFEKRVREEETQKQVLFQAVIREWKEEDLAFWSGFGITLSTLKKYYVFPASKIYKDKFLIYQYDIKNPCYVYYFPKSNHMKCYFPYNRRQRFYGNVNNLEDIQGYYQCNIKEGKREDKLLILTKSMKDVMVLREMGYDAMAIHGENHRFQDDFIRHINKYYGKIVSLYDRDLSGILGGKRLWREHKIKPFFINKTFFCKDISDMYMTYGEEIVREFLVSLQNKS